MANETRYYDTPYTFISPVRHFKSNDPYYYEVDNIPIKQLEESQKFLKDQVDGIITRQNNKKDIEIDRSGFSELKPYATGNDRKVRVKPGKFTARINNAYDLTPLQVVAQIEGFSNIDRTTEGINKWRVDTNIGSYVSDVLQQFQDGLTGDALNMNGLAERAFTFPIWDEDGLHLANTLLVGAAVSGTTTPGYSQFDGDFDPDDRSLYPNYIGAVLKHSTPETTRDLTLIKGVFTSEVDAGQQGRTESEFIKRWRGAIRTSIVDVPEELSITVPDFDAGDYFYTDANGDNQPLAANHRIDLLFIYSKAVDEESTTIPKFDSNGNPTTLTQPALGILKGAGIGISRQTAANDNNADDRVSLTTLDGTPIMLAHPGDENGTTNGFTTSAGVIKGSFPSPDDLMNLAPVLSENLETTAFQLIGQSILPIAYVRVQTPAGAIADILNDEDIIDIRPFFRTTELAYNERAGIAAATPQVSIANPVVTEAHLEKVRKEVVHDLRNRIDNIDNGGGNSPPGPGPDIARVVAAGTITGGFYGPEGALMRHAVDNIAGVDYADYAFNLLADDVESEFGYPAGSISTFPSWDKSEWYRRGSFGGNSVNDCINVGLGWCVHFNGPGDWWKAKNTPPLRAPLNSLTTAREVYDTVGTYETQALQGWGAGSGKNDTFRSGMPSVVQQSGDYQQLLNEGMMGQIYFVSKRVKLNFENTSWVDDYHVDVELLNCIPVSQGNGNQAQSSNVWVNKYKDYFIINVAWVARDWPNSGGINATPWSNRNDPLRFSGFTLPQVRLIGTSPFRYYPADVITIPRNQQSNYNQRLSFFNNTINPGLAPTDVRYANISWFSGMHPLVYPSVTFKVTGLPSNVVQRGNGSNGALMRQNNPTISCV